jgi:hypothetical protein
MLCLITPVILAAAADGGDAHGMAAITRPVPHEIAQSVGWYRPAAKAFRLLRGLLRLVTGHPACLIQHHCEAHATLSTGCVPGCNRWLLVVVRGGGGVLLLLQAASSYLQEVILRTSSRAQLAAGLCPSALTVAPLPLRRQWQRC